MRTYTTTNNKPGQLHHQGMQKIGKLFFWLFSFSLFLFMMQAWAPRIYSFPLQILLIWVLFVGFFLLHGSLLKDSLTVFSPVQWGAIGALGISIFLRSALDGWDMLRFGQFMTGVMIALLGSEIFQSERGRKILIVTLSLGATASGIFAILQYFNFAPWLWQASKYTGEGYVRGSTGLENNPVAFAYSIVGIATVLTGLWLIRWRYHIKLIALPSGLVAAFGLLSIVGLIVSNSRSGLFGLTLGTMILLFASGRAVAASQQPVLSKGHKRYASARHRNRGWMLLTGYMLLLALGGVIAYAVTVQDTGVLQDARLGGTWRAYFLPIWRNPLGIPGGADLIQAFEQGEISEYVSAIQRAGGNLLAPHNLFLTTGISYGPLAMLALFVLYATALSDGKRAYSSLLQAGNTQVALWVLLLIAANIAVVTHSWFHNASIAIGEMRNWLWLGFLLALVQRNNSNRLQEVYGNDSKVKRE